MTRNELNDFSKEADQHIISQDYASLEKLIERLTTLDFDFEHSLYEAYYFYTLLPV
ncbi:hypothetical protein [Vibrio sp. TRT 29B02]|uniref:hypothetical protein n=1 Tax=Vibrio sp. TRT 29B02 TaxID=3418508 RepID=UPI003CEABFF2